MASIHRLPKVTLLNAVSVSGTNTYTSAINVNILFLDNVAVQINSTGSPVGTANIQVSVDHQEDAQGNVIVAGNWVTAAALTINANTPIIYELNQEGAPYLRVQYVNASSSGTISAFVSGKGIG